MPQNRAIPLHFPIGGVQRRYAYQRQGPYSTPDANNIWPTDGTTGRERGAGVRVAPASKTMQRGVSEIFIERK